VRENHTAPILTPRLIVLHNNQYRLIFCVNNINYKLVLRLPAFCLLAGGHSAWHTRNERLNEPPRYATLTPF
jgi:hypothetical protein